MESAFGKLVDTILTGSGIMGALFVLSIIALVFMWKELRSTDDKRAKEASECERLRSELFEKRLEEARLVATALQANTATIAALTTSVDARSQVLSDLLKAVQMLASDATSSRQQFGSLGDRMERKLDQILERAK
jgi:small-conductance mechanosensitive channel